LIFAPIEMAALENLVDSQSAGSHLLCLRFSEYDPQSQLAPEPFKQRGARHILIDEALSPVETHHDMRIGDEVATQL
jgi:hypothetical protein